MEHLRYTTNFIHTCKTIKHTQFLNTNLLDPFSTEDGDSLRIAPTTLFKTSFVSPTSLVCMLQTDFPIVRVLPNKTTTQTQFHNETTEQLRRPTTLFCASLARKDGKATRPPLFHSFATRKNTIFMHFYDLFTNILGNFNLSLAIAWFYPFFYYI